MRFLLRDAVGRPITILINNAGIMPAKPLLKFTPSEIERIFQVNVFSQFWMLFEFLPDLLTLDHGHVVSMCSVAGITGKRINYIYCAMSSYQAYSVSLIYII